MARASDAGGSNGKARWWREFYEREQGRAEESPGTSSSTSESRLDRSGTSGTTALPSPAQTAESPFDRDPLARPASSSVSSTDGSGLVTGSSPSSPSDSSEGSAAPKEAIQVPDPEADLPSEQLMAMAREEYFSRNFDRSERLLDLAEANGEDPVAVASARGYVRDARNVAQLGAPPRPALSGAGPSEEDPGAGGLLVP